VRKRSIDSKQRSKLVVRGAAGLVALVAGLSAVSGGEVARADPVQHIWLHYDYMVASDHSDAPDPAAIQMVVDAFAAHGIQLHVDPQHTAIPEVDFVFFKGAGGGDCAYPTSAQFSDLKAQYFHPTSNHEWHYAIFGYAGGFCSSGIADLPGDDFFVALGQSLPTLDQWPRDMRLAWEGGTFMHELGHNLNLHHGGDDDINYKPNYLSVMNYAYQGGIRYGASPGSTTPVGLRLDYSEQALPPLDENNLNESLGIQDPGSTDIVHFFLTPQDPSVCGIAVYGFGRPGAGPASGPIDWNLNGVSTDAGISAIINSDACDPPQVLTGFDDWAEVHQYLADQDKHPKNPGPPQS
jgi:hypothetical protein